MLQLRQKQNCTKHTHTQHTQTHARAAQKNNIPRGKARSQVLNHGLCACPLTSFHNKRRVQSRAWTRTTGSRFIQSSRQSKFRSSVGRSGGRSRSLGGAMSVSCAAASTFLCFFHDLFLFEFARLIIHSSVLSMFVIFLHEMDL